MKSTYKQFWDQFLQSTGRDSSGDEAPLVDEFGDNPQTADYLIGLVLDGRKTATCGLVLEYERDNYPIPKVGDQKIFINGDREPVCIVEVTEVEIKPFNEIDEAFAYDEGEDDRTYDSWHREHVKYFTRSLATKGKEFNENLPAVCERFRVIFK